MTAAKHLILFSDGTWAEQRFLAGGEMRRWCHQQNSKGMKAVVRVFRELPDGKMTPQNIPSK